MNNANNISVEVELSTLEHNLVRFGQRLTPANLDRMVARIEKLRAAKKKAA